MIGEEFIGMEDYIVFDIETTGFSMERDKIIEIAALKVRSGCVVEEYSTLVDPDCIIPFYVAKLTGINTNMVKGAPKIEEALGGFLNFVGDSILVGHNIKSFDMRFIRGNAEKCLGRCVHNELVDTYQLARRCIPGLKSYKLEKLAKYYGVSYAGAHRALADCYITYQIYKRLLR